MQIIVCCSIYVKQQNMFIDYCYDVTRDYAYLKQYLTKLKNGEFAYARIRKMITLTTAPPDPVALRKKMISYIGDVSHPTPHM